MTRQLIFSSDGKVLHFEATDTDLYEDYEKEKEALLVKYYKLLRDRNGIYAENQGKYVSSVDKLNGCDSKVMENLYSKYYKENKK